MTVDPERSRIMRAVKSRDTAPEMTVRRLVYAMGYRYRLHRKDLPGKPDLVFQSRRKVIFVHGCFWHGHDCKRGARVPKTNSAYWENKITRNMERDNQHAEELKRAGWRVLVIWECQTKEEASLVDLVDGKTRNGNSRTLKRQPPRLGPEGCSDRRGWRTR